LEYCLS